MFSPPLIDLVSPSSFAGGHPHEQYRWLREHDPVHWHPEPEGPGFWAITRHGDVAAVSHDPETFSSWAGGVMLADGDPAVLEGSRMMMLYKDPPDHTRYRRLVSKGFTPRSAGSWKDRIDVLAAQIVDRVVEQGKCDLVADLAGEMPSYVIAELMGIPRDDGRRLYQLTEIMHSADPALTEAERITAVMEMHAYAAGVAARKRSDPADDLASLLVNASVDGEHLGDDEFNWFFLLLVNAGGDTTRNLVAAGVEALLQRPAELHRLVSDVDRLMPTAVEELLRFVSPVVHMRRTATRDATLEDRLVRAGDKVVVFYGAANRDERVFADPDRLDVGRDPNPHLAFGGGGPHFCLGASFARIEAASLLREMLTRLPDLEAAGPPERLTSNFIAGPKHFPVRFTPVRLHREA